MLKVKECWHYLLKAGAISFFVARKSQKIKKKKVKIANIDREILHFSWFLILLKATKIQGFAVSLEDTFYEIPQGESNWPPPPPLQSF